jgi:hypothetical protein
MLALPSFIRDTHGEISATVVLDLSSLVNQGLRARVVKTINALAFVSTHDSSLETLYKKEKGEESKGGGTIYHETLD